MMKIGDLIKVKQFHRDWASTGEIYGLITEIEKDFYIRANDISSRKHDRYTILWDCGGISSEPEGYVEKVNDEKSSKT